MSKLGFLFPGQGSQQPGMGSGLREAYPEAKAVFEEADDVLGFALSQLCFEGPEEELKLTQNTQPAILTTSIAAYRVLETRVPAPNYVAGHSLGEYSACVAAGTLTFADALRLVRKRGEFMQIAVPAGVGAMAALLKLPEGALDSILQEAAQGQIVSAANFNSPDQVVIAGHSQAVTRAMELAKVAGAKRVVLLPVSAPFHCALMDPAQEQMRPLLETTDFHTLKFPLVNNVDAMEVTDPSRVRNGLIEQISRPVRWTETIRYLASAGVKHCVEVGPGAVLTGLLRSIDAAVAGSKFNQPDNLPLLLEALAVQSPTVQ